MSDYSFDSTLGRMPLTGKAPTPAHYVSGVLLPINSANLWGYPVSTLKIAFPGSSGGFNSVDDYQTIADSIFNAPTLEALAALAYKYYTDDWAKLLTAVEGNAILQVAVDKLNADAKIATDCVNHIYSSTDAASASKKTEASGYLALITAKMTEIGNDAKARLAQLGYIANVASRVQCNWQQTTPDTNIVPVDKSAKLKLADAKNYVLQSYLFSLDIDNYLASFNFLTNQVYKKIDYCNDLINKIEIIEQNLYGIDSYLGKRDNQAKIAQDAADKAAADQAKADLATVYDGLYLSAKDPAISVSPYLVKVLDFLKSNNTVISVPGSVTPYVNGEDIATRLAKSRGNLLFNIDHKKFKNEANITPEDIDAITMWSGGSVSDGEIKAFLSGKVPTKQPARIETPDPVITPKNPEPIGKTPAPVLINGMTKDVYDLIDASDKIYASLNKLLISQNKPQLADTDYYAIGDTARGGKGVPWTITTATKIRDTLQKMLDDATGINAGLVIVNTPDSILASADVIHKQLVALNAITDDDYDQLVNTVRGSGAWTAESAKEFYKQLQDKLTAALPTSDNVDITVAGNKFKVPLIIAAGGVAAIVLWLALRK